MSFSVRSSGASGLATTAMKRPPEPSSSGSQIAR
jgi:hypothetical protein